MRQFKLSRKERLLFLTPLLLLPIPLLCNVISGGDKMDKAQRELAGVNAIDCGVGHIEMAENNVMHEIRAEVDACSVAAFKAGRPFRARYDTNTDLETDESFGVVRTPQGQTYFIYYEWDTTGFWWQREESYRQAVCPAPELITHTSLTDKVWEAVGCGTCSNMASEDTANCILHPLVPLEPSAK